MILKIKPCCPLTDTFEIVLSPLLTRQGEQKLYECVVRVHDGKYIAIYCRMCGKKIELEVE